MALKYQWIGIIASLSLFVGCANSPTTTAQTDASLSDTTQLGAADADPENKINFEKATRLNLELAVAYLENGNTSRAKEKLNRALKLGPQLPEVYSAHGYYYEKIGEIASAEENYKKAIRMDSRSGQYRNNYGAFLCRQARYDDAEKEFLAAVRDKSYAKSAETYENLGLCALDAKNKEKAKQYFVRALKQDTGRPEALLELAMMSYEEKDFNTAATYFDRYRQGTDYSARALWIGIKIAEARNHEDEAASLKLLLKNQFPNSKEYRVIKQNEPVG